MNFYASLAEDYDDLTRFSERLKSEESLLRKWIDPEAVKTVLDSACGTGLHAIIMAGMGIKVTGVDVSPEMIGKAKANAVNSKACVSWHVEDMRHFENIHGKFDSIICLGNSIPHLLDEKDLDATLSGFGNMLSPKGFILLQMLNYEKVLNNKDRIVGINRKEGREYIRFYDFNGSLINFNILTVIENQGVLTHSLQSTMLKPYRKNDMAFALKKNGFAKTCFYGGLDQSEYSAENSPNLVIMARLI